MICSNTILKDLFPSNWMTIHLEYISKYKPITFILDGKTKYTAEAQLIRGRFYSGYTLICTEILEDTET